MGVFTDAETPSVQNAKLYRPGPPRGAPHSVAVPGTQKQGRSAVYRHWRFKDNLLESLDPNVSMRAPIAGSSARILTSATGQDVP